MKVEFSAFPKAFTGNVAVFVGTDKQLQASAKAIEASSAITQTMVNLRT